MKNYLVEPGEIALFHVQAPDLTYTTLGCRGVIYNSSGSVVVSAFNYSHVANGLYRYSWADNLGEGKYILQNLFYTDGTYVTLADVIQPDADGVEVVHYKFRPTLGGPDTPVIVKKELTEEDLEKLADKVYDKLLPELKKKSEFNPVKDVVKTDQAPVEKLSKFLVQRLNILENALPNEKEVFKRNKEYLDKVKKEICKDIYEVRDYLYTVNNSDVIGLLNNYYNQFNTITTTLTDMVRLGFSDGTNFENLKQQLEAIVLAIKGVNVLEAVKPVADYLSSLEEKIVDLADQTELSKQLDVAIGLIQQVKDKDSSNDFTKIELRVSNSFKSLDETLLDLKAELNKKDELDDKRIRVLLETIKILFVELTNQSVVSNKQLNENLEKVLNFEPERVNED